MSKSIQVKVNGNWQPITDNVKLLPKIVTHIPTENDIEDGEIAFVIPCMTVTYVEHQGLSGGVVTRAPGLTTYWDIFKVTISLFINNDTVILNLPTYPVTTNESFALDSSGNYTFSLAHGEVGGYQGGASPFTIQSERYPQLKCDITEISIYMYNNNVHGMEGYGYSPGTIIYDSFIGIIAPDKA